MDAEKGSTFIRSERAVCRDECLRFLPVSVLFLLGGFSTIGFIFQLDPANKSYRIGTQLILSSELDPHLLTEEPEERHDKS